MKLTALAYSFAILSGLIAILMAVVQEAPAATPDRRAMDLQRTIEKLEKRVDAFDIRLTKLEKMQSSTKIGGTTTVPATNIVDVVQNLDQRLKLLEGKK